MDKAVEAAYGVDFDGDEEKIIAQLFKLYAEVLSSNKWPFSGPSGHFGQDKTRYFSDFSLRYRVFLVAGTGFEPATSGVCISF